MFGSGTIIKMFLRPGLTWFLECTKEPLECHFRITVYTEIFLYSVSAKLYQTVSFRQIVFAIPESGGCLDKFQDYFLMTQNRANNVHKKVHASSLLT